MEDGPFGPYIYFRKHESNLWDLQRLFQRVTIYEIVITLVAPVKLFQSLIIYERYRKLKDKPQWHREIVLWQTKPVEERVAFWLLTISNVRKHEQNLWDLQRLFPYDTCETYKFVANTYYLLKAWKKQATMKQRECYMANT